MALNSRLKRREMVLITQITMVIKLRRMERTEIKRSHLGKQDITIRSSKVSLILKAKAILITIKHRKILITQVRFYIDIRCQARIWLQINSKNQRRVLHIKRAAKVKQRTKKEVPNQRRNTIMKKINHNLICTQMEV